MKKPDIYLADILESIHRIETYSESGRDTFSQSFLIQDGIIRNLEIIGEAANQLGEQFHTTHPEIAWRGMISLRNMVIHQYHRVDLNLVWQVVIKDLPELKKHILAIQQSLKDPNHPGV